MTDQQLTHKANGISRIKTALMFPDGEIGTFYSNPFNLKYEINGQCLADIIGRHKTIPKTILSFINRILK
jgi:hypothetical protein